MKKLFLLPVFTFLIMLQSNAQQVDYAKAMLNNPRYNVNLEVLFNKQNTNEEVEIEVDKNVLILDLDIYIELTSGKMKAEILDVNGEVVREIKLNSSLSQANIIAEGTLNERIKQPEPGIWKIKFTPRNATSKTSIAYKTLFRD